MKHLVLLSLILALTTNCQSTAQQDDFLSCISGKFHQQGQDYLSAMQETEQSLVVLGHLKDGSGKSYVELAQEIKAANEFSVTIVPASDLMFQDSIWRVCINQYPVEIDDKINRYQEVQSAFDEADDISPSFIMDVFLKLFKPEDFDKIAVKHFFLATIYSIQDIDRGIRVKLPPWADEEPDVTKLKSRNIFSVLVNAQNQLLVRGQLTEVEDLRAMAKEFITNPQAKEDLAESPQKAIISLKNDRGTAYGEYLKVYNELKGAYHDLWEEYSQWKYGRPYSDDMPIEMRRAIHNAIPFVISEAEPTGF